MVFLIQGIRPYHKEVHKSGMFIISKPKPGIDFKELDIIRPFPDSCLFEVHYLDLLADKEERFISKPSKYKLSSYI